MNLLLGSIQKYAKFIFENQWTKEENEAFLSLIKGRKGSRLVDLGCGDGRLTLLFAEKAKAGEIVGIEPAKIKRRIDKRKIKIISANLNRVLPLPSNYFDVAISHFSIEHLYNVNVFIMEIKRILKKDGYVLVATDNLASWPNVLSLLAGWQPFSMAYGVSDKPLGNPFASGGDFVVEEGDSLGELSHNKVLSYKMVIDVFKEYGFRIGSIIGVGYFPFFGSFSRFFSSLDKRHSHLLILKAYKK